MKGYKISSFAVFFSVSFLVAGCSGLDRMGAKLDMAMGTKQASGRMAYEGQLEALRHVGSMTALQFKDGQYFDVLNVSEAFYPGDIIRVYETPKGYEAHLWRSTQNASHQTAPAFGG